MHQYAFLNGKIDREKFVTVPPSIDHDPKRFMYRLKKTFYRLDIALVCFNREIDSFLKLIGFQQNPREL